MTEQRDLPAHRWKRSRRWRTGRSWTNYSPASSPRPKGEPGWPPLELFRALLLATRHPLPPILRFLGA
jgi:hypothetical protein